MHRKLKFKIIIKRIANQLKFFVFWMHTYNRKQHVTALETRNTKLQKTQISSISLQSIRVLACQSALITIFYIHVYQVTPMFTWLVNCTWFCKPICFWCFASMKSLPSSDRRIALSNLALDWTAFSVNRNWRPTDENLSLETDIL